MLHKFDFYRDFFLAKRIASFQCKAKNWTKKNYWILKKKKKNQRYCVFERHMFMKVD